MPCGPASSPTGSATSASTDHCRITWKRRVGDAVRDAASHATTACGMDGSTMAPVSTVACHCPSGSGRTTRDVERSPSTTSLKLRVPLAVPCTGKSPRTLLSRNGSSCMRIGAIGTEAVRCATSQTRPLRAGTGKLMRPPAPTMTSAGIESMPNRPFKTVPGASPVFRLSSSVSCSDELKITNALAWL